ncbi:MAG: hypothetical protein ACFE9Z_01645 [Promethearchaeota archaeon]
MLGCIVIFSISLSMLIPIVKSLSGTEYIPSYGSFGIALPQLNEGDVLRWSFRDHDYQFYVKFWMEDFSGNYDLSEGIVQDGGDWTVPSGVVGSNCLLWFENLAGPDGYIDYSYQLNPEPEAIPGYFIFVVLGIFSVVSFLLIRKVNKI